MKSKPGEHIAVYNLAELFQKAYSTVATIAKGVSGFQSTDIHPMNSEVFSNEDFPFDNGNEEERGKTPTGDTVNGEVSFQEVSPIPQINSSSKNIARKQHSTILTESPQKVILEEKRARTLQRQQKKKCKMQKF